MSIWGGGLNFEIIVTRVQHYDLKLLRPEQINWNGVPVVLTSQLAKRYILPVVLHTCMYGSSNFLLRPPVVV